MRAGDRLGSFEIVAFIGAGGMGEVYEAHDLRLGRRVALKVIARSLSDDADAAARFEREARAVAALSHPNILAIHEFDRSGGVLYTVTEFLEGETLRTAIERHRIGWRRAVEIAIAICDGLAAAHAKGIVHRDLKPENVFITNEGAVKILDFGLATVAAPQPAASNAVTRTAPHVAGTPGYMSPEQLRGEVADERSDIFSLGCALYEMLARTAPFARSTYAASIAATLDDDPEPLASGSGEIAPAIATIVERCLAKRKEQRFQTARDLRFALQSAALQSNGPRPGWRSHLRLAGAVSAVLVAAALGGVVFTRNDAKPLSAPPPKSMSSLVVLPFENLSGDEAQEYFTTGMTEALTSELAQIGSLRVISRTTAMQYKSAKKTVPQIARELDIEGVVEGSVLRSGNRVRITAQLIDGRTDRHVWSRSYERDLSDVIALQREVALDIVNGVRAQLTPQEQQRLASSSKIDPAAYELYLKGRKEQRGMSFSKSAAYFVQSIERDPGFAPAHAALAKSYAAMLFFGEHVDEEWSDAARAAAERAVALDERLPEAHLALADWKVESLCDLAGGRREVERALALDRNHADAHDAMATYLAFEGNTAGALAELKKAAELDPQTQRRYNQVADLCYRMGDYEAAITWTRRGMPLPDIFFDDEASRSIAARSLARLGRFDEAIAEAGGNGPGARRALDLGLIYKLTGRTAEMRESLAAVEKDDDRGRRAEAHAIAGEYDAAVDDIEPWLRGGHAATVFLMFSKVVPPEWLPLRNHPRVVAALKQWPCISSAPTRRSILGP